MFEVWRNVYILQGRLLFVCRSTRRKTSCQPRSQPMRNCKLFWLNTGKIEWWTIILFTSTCILQCLCDNSWNWFCNVYPNTFHQWLIEYFNRAIAEHYINISLNITRWSSTVCVIKYVIKLCGLYWICSTQPYLITLHYSKNDFFFENKRAKNTCFSAYV